MSWPSGLGPCWVRIFREIISIISFVINFSHLKWRLKKDIVNSKDNYENDWIIQSEFLKIICNYYVKSFLKTQQFISTGKKKRFRREIEISVKIPHLTRRQLVFFVFCEEKRKCFSCAFLFVVERTQK